MSDIQREIYIRFRTLENFAELRENHWNPIFSNFIDPSQQSSC